MNKVKKHLDGINALDNKEVEEYKQALNFVGLDYKFKE